MDLIEFLKEKGAYRQFCANVYTLRNDREPADFTYLDCAFTWADTPEGHDFWGSLAADFNKMLTPRNDLKWEIEDNGTHIDISANGYHVMHLYNDGTFKRIGAVGKGIGIQVNTKGKILERSYNGI